MKCEVCDIHEATMKDYRDGGDKYRSCQYCGHLSSKNWYYVLYSKEFEGLGSTVHNPVDPKTFYEEEDE